jgi:hypothetical protein
MIRWKLVLLERERFGLVYSRDPVRHLCCDPFRTTRALLPLPLQHLGQRLATEALRILLRKLADGEVCFLLVGTRSTESYTQDLHLCATGATALRRASHLARSRYHRLGQDNP